MGVDRCGLARYAWGSPRLAGHALLWAYDNACTCDRYRTNTIRSPTATPWVAVVWSAHRQAMGSLDEPKFACGHRRHTQQHDAMSESGDVRGTVDAFLVVHRYVSDSQVEACRAEEQIEVTEWIEVTEV